MRSLFRWLTSILFAAVVIQVGLAGYGAFDAIHKAKSAPVSKKALEDSFGAHGVFGYIVLLVMLVAFIVASSGGLGSAKTKWAGGILVLGILQAVLGGVSPSVPALGFLHGINALAIYAAVALLAHKTWTEDKTAAVSPT
jgi:hypothetical protein